MTGRPLLHRIGDAGSAVGRTPPSGRRLRVALQLGLALLVFGFLVLAVLTQLDELRDRDVRFEAVWLLLALPVLLAFFTAGGLGWDLVVRSLGTELHPARAQMVWGQSLLARYVPGSLLFVVGRVVLAEREGVARRVTLASFVYEIGLQFTAALMVGAFFLIDHPDLSGEPARWAVLAVIPVGLGVFHPRVFGRISTVALARIGRAPLPVVMPMRGVLVLTVYYAGVWALAGVALTLVGRSIFPLGVGDLPVVASAQALAFCAAVLTIVFPSGLGVRDGAFAWALTALPGVTFAVGAAVAIAVRFGLTVAELAFVAAITAIGRRTGHSFRELEASEPQGDP